LEYRRGAARPETIVKRQNDFLITKEITPFEMLNAEFGRSSRIDLHDA
jgi:hypothetical protein